MICNFMIFLEYVGSRASLSAKSENLVIFTLFYLNIYNKPQPRVNVKKTNETRVNVKI